MDPLDGQPHSEVAADVLRRLFRLRETPSTEIRASSSAAAEASAWLPRVWSASPAATRLL
jgi:hypothetical protein